MTAARRVLVVDDEESIRETVRLALALEGYEVLTAADGARALALVRDQPPDVVLLDMRMPVMDGWQFMAAYRQAPEPHARVIVFTAANDPAARASEVHADAFLAKPFDLDTLLELVAAPAG